MFNDLKENYNRESERDKAIFAAYLTLTIFIYIFYKKKRKGMTTLNVISSITISHSHRMQLSTTILICIFIIFIKPPATLCQKICTQCTYNKQSRY